MANFLNFSFTESPRSKKKKGYCKPTSVSLQLILVFEDQKGKLPISWNEKELLKDLSPILATSKSFRRATAS